MGAEKMFLIRETAELYDSSSLFNDVLRLKNNEHVS